MFGLKRKNAEAEALITPSLIEELNLDVEYTPDYAELVMTEGQLVFCPDEMMRGRRAHDLVENDLGMYMCTAQTNQVFTMFKKTLGKFTRPVVMDANEFPGKYRLVDYAPIKGEVYLLKPQQLKELDKWKKNTKIFTRRRVYLDIEYQFVHEERRVYSVKGPGNEPLVRWENVPIRQEWEHYHKQDAWMYVGNPEYFFWEGFADPTFAQVKLKTSSDRNVKPYFYYSPKEDAK